MIRRIVFCSLAFSLVACSTPNPVTSQPAGTPSPSVSAVPTASPTPQGFRLSGIVYDDDQAVLSGVDVTALRDGQAVASAQTGAKGEYSLVVPAGDYVVTAAKPGFTHRSRSAKISGDASLHFGGQDPQGFQRSFLSTLPEVEDVKVTEEAPGKGLAIVMTMSEPLTEASRQSFVDRLEVRAPEDKAFLSPAGRDGALVPETKWDESGKVLTLRYAGPYLPTGIQAVGYTLKLRQQDLGTVNPTTNEKDFEELGIKDAEGNSLGFDRADYIFYQPAGQEYLSYPLMTDKAIAYTPRKRAWYLTHRGTQVHVAAQDTTGPAIKEIIPMPGVRLGSDKVDAVKVRFSEPMRVVRNVEEQKYTQLKEDEPFVEISTASKTDGSDAKRLPTSAIRYLFDDQDPSIMTLYFSPNTFLDKRWVEIALTDKAMDPAGNKPDRAANRMSATIK